MAIARGRIYHSVLEDLRFLVTLAFKRGKHFRKVNEFENLFSKYVGRKYCVSFAFARTGLYFTLKALNFPPGSKILLTPITIKAMLDVILAAGLVPIFVDLDPKTGFMSKDSLDAVLRKNRNEVKACLLTYLFGISPNLREITNSLQNSKILIIEDFSQCLNGEVDVGKVGLIGELALYSSSSVKTLDCHGGGHVLTDNFSLQNKIRYFQMGLRPTPKLTLLRKSFACLAKNFLSRNPTFSVLTFPIIFLAAKLNLEVFVRFVGTRSTSPLAVLPSEWFYRFTEEQAEFAIRMLDRIRENDKKRVAIASTFTKKISKQMSLIGHEANYSVHWQFIILPMHPKQFMDKLRAKRIDSAMTSLILLSELSGYDLRAVTPNASYIYYHAVYIPCYPSLSSKGVKKIVDAINC